MTDDDDNGKWKRYAMAILRATLDNEGVVFDSDWILTADERAEIMAALDAELGGAMDYEL